MLLAAIAAGTDEVAARSATSRTTAFFGGGVLATGEHTAVTIVEVTQRDLGISQVAVSRALERFAPERVCQSSHRWAAPIYSVDSRPLQQVNSWLGQFRGFGQT
jgi:hypothetical protein